MDILAVDAKILQVYIIQSVIIKGILQLVLDIEEGDQNKLGEQHDKVTNPLRGLGPNVENYGWGIDQWKNVNEDLTIGLKGNWCSVNVDRMQVFN